MWRAGRLVAIAPDFDLCGSTLDLNDRSGSLDEIGPDPYVLLAETSAIGLVDAAGFTAAGIAAVLMSWDVDGDTFVLMRRDLGRALWVSWDRADGGTVVGCTDGSVG